MILRSAICSGPAGLTELSADWPSVRVPHGLSEMSLLAFAFRHLTSRCHSAQTALQCTAGRRRKTATTGSGPEQIESLSWCTVTCLTAVAGPSFSGGAMAKRISTGECLEVSSAGLAVRPPAPTLSPTGGKTQGSRSRICKARLNYGNCLH